MNINGISFLSTVLATISVVGFSLYGAARFFSVRKFLAACGFLTLTPLWFCVQLLSLVLFDKLKSEGIASREYHLDYAITPLANLLGAALVGYLVIHFVTKLASPLPDDKDQLSHIDTREGNWGWLPEPKKAVGVVFILAGVAAMSAFFFIAGVLFIIVGVSVIMDVRIWRG